MKSSDMLDDRLTQWLSEEAENLDRGHGNAEDVLPQLARAELFGIGVEESLGGVGGDVADALEAIAQVAAHSLTAAFVFWGQRAFIEYLLASDNAALRERLSSDLLAGRIAGATGLSNAMKYLAGIASLGVVAQPTAQESWRLAGRLPWVTNLRKAGFVVAAAVEVRDGKPFIAALPDTSRGLVRSEDLQLLGLQSSNTAAIDLNDVALGSDWVVAEDARNFLPRVRPAFLGLQCGMSVGLARRSLKETQGHLAGTRSVLFEDWQVLTGSLETQQEALRDGLRQGRFVQRPVELFQIRIALAELVASALRLELQARGGKAYLLPQGEAFARRWRESAFVPVVTPSLVQLRTELRRHGHGDAA